jgi:hypothetical protein
MIPVPQVNNQSMLLKQLDTMKRKDREKPKASSHRWNNKTLANSLLGGGCPGKGQSEIVDPGAYTEEIFDRQQPDFQKASDADPKSGLPSIIDFDSFRKLGIVLKSKRGNCLRKATNF